MEEKIYELLVRAKRYYINWDMSMFGMCFFIEKAAVEAGLIENSKNYEGVYNLIPEFNPTYLGGSNKVSYWWDISDRESRIKAFDKLINLYADKVKLCQAGE